MEESTELFETPEQQQEPQATETLAQRAERAAAARRGAAQQPAGGSLIERAKRAAEIRRIRTSAIPSTDPDVHGAIIPAPVNPETVAEASALLQPANEPVQFEKSKNRSPNFYKLRPDRAPEDEAPTEKATVGDRAYDVAASVIKGVVGVPEAALGLADLARMATNPAEAGRPGFAALAESMGFKPKEARAFLDQFYSDAQKRSNRSVQESEGIVGKASAALSHPSVIAHSVIESLPSMIAGGGVARGAMAVAPRMGAMTAGALGEGAVSAGQTAEQVRQASPSGVLDAKQAAIAAGSGAATGLLSAFGGRLAQKLGIADVETMLAGAAAHPAAGRGLARQIVYGAISEGFIEELPQSVQEQIAQNAALGKPLAEGVDGAAVLGAFAGAAMGGGANITERLGEMRQSAIERRRLNLAAAKAKETAKPSKEEHDAFAAKATETLLDRMYERAAAGEKVPGFGQSPREPMPVAVPAPVPATQPAPVQESAAPAEPAKAKIARTYVDGTGQKFITVQGPDGKNIDVLVRGPSDGTKPNDFGDVYPVEASKAMALDQAGRGAALNKQIADKTAAEKAVSPRPLEPQGDPKGGTRVATPPDFGSSVPPDDRITVGEPVPAEGKRFPASTQAIIDLAKQKGVSIDEAVTQLRSANYDVPDDVIRAAGGTVNNPVTVNKTEGGEQNPSKVADLPGHDVKTIVNANDFGQFARDYAAKKGIPQEEAERTIVSMYRDLLKSGMSPKDAKGEVGAEFKSIIDELETKEPASKQEAKSEEQPASAAAATPSEVEKGATKPLTINPDSRYGAEEGNEQVLHDSGVKQARSHYRDAQELKAMLESGKGPSGRVLTPKQRQEATAEHNRSMRLYQGTVDELGNAFGQDVADKARASIESTAQASKAGGANAEQQQPAAEIPAELASSVREEFAKPDSYSDKELLQLRDDLRARSTVAKPGERSALEFRYRAQLVQEELTRRGIADEAAEYWPPVTVTAAPKKRIGAKKVAPTSTISDEKRAAILAGQRAYAEGKSLPDEDDEDTPPPVAVKGPKKPVGPPEYSADESAQMTRDVDDRLSRATIKYDKKHGTTLFIPNDPAFSDKPADWHFVGEKLTLEEAVERHKKWMAGNLKWYRPEGAPAPNTPATKRIGKKPKVEIPEGWEVVSQPQGEGFPDVYRIKAPDGTLSPLDTWGERARAEKSLPDFIPGGQFHGRMKPRPAREPAPDDGTPSAAERIDAVEKKIAETSDPETIRELQKERDSADIAARDEKVVARTKSLEPLEDGKVNPSSYAGNITADDSKYVTDARVAVLRSAIGDPAVAEKLSKRGRTKEVRDRRVDDTLMDKMWASQIERADTPATTIGVLRDSGLKVATNLAYIATADGRTVGVNAEALAMAMEVSGADRVKAWTGNHPAVVLYDGDTPVAIVVGVSPRVLPELDEETVKQLVADAPAPVKREKKAASPRIGAKKKAVQAEAPAAEKPKFDYSSTQINLPPGPAAKLERIAAEIPDEDLAAEGREKEPHITVKFGLHGNNPDAVRALLANEPPVQVSFGKTSLFQNDEADVLKVDVDSADLHRLNKKIADALPNTDTHPEYVPHATIAYVKPGLGKKYADNPIMKGDSFVIKQIVFSGQDGTQTVVPLGGKRIGIPQIPAMEGFAPLGAKPIDAGGIAAEAIDKMAAPKIGAKNVQNLAAEAETPASAEDVAKLMKAGLDAIKSNSFPTGSKVVRDWAEKVLGRPFSSGTWHVDDVYDALEGAANEWMRTHGGGIGERHSVERLKSVLASAREMEAKLFTGRLRSAGMMEKMQFSTPLPLSVGAAWALGTIRGEKVLEPTAGTGNLITPLHDAGVTIRANELDPRRAAVLKELGFDVTSDDALTIQLDGTRVNAVIMNPPFGSHATGKYSGQGALPFKDGDVAQRFVAAALNSLVEGGRLVAIMPPNTMGQGGKAFRDWLTKEHTPVLYLESPDGAYRGRGTETGTIMLVVDKGTTAAKRRADWPGAKVITEANTGVEITWDVWTSTLEQFAPGKPLARTGGHEPAVDVAAAKVRRLGSQKQAVIQEGDSGPSRQLGSSPARGVDEGSGAEPARRIGARNRSDESAGGPDVGAERGTERSAGVVAGQPSGPGRPDADNVAAADVVPELSRGRTESRAGDSQERRAELAAANDSAVFAPYVGGIEQRRAPHPRLVVETRAMAGMPAPPITTQPPANEVMAAWGRDGAQGGISDEQLDAILRTTTAWDNGHGMLVSDDVGVGKSREAAGSALEAIAQGAKRILYITKNETNLIDAQREFRAVASGSEEGDFPAMFVTVGEYPKVKKGEDSLPMPDDRPVIYLAHSYNFREFADALLETNLDTLLADEAHEFKNLFADRGMAWQGLHAQMLEKPDARFAYFTATPGVSLDELGYLFGLREWPVGGFSDWVDRKLGFKPAEEVKEDTKAADAAAITERNKMRALGEAGMDALAADDTDIKKGKRRFMRGAPDVFAMKVTPAETEQVMRELKGSGKYISRDLWRGGVKFDVESIDLTGSSDEAKAARTRYDQAAEFVRELTIAAQKFGRMNQKVKTAGLDRALIQSYMKQLLFDLRFPAVLRAAKEALKDGKQVVISINTVAGDAPLDEGISAADADVPLNKRLESAINRINTQEIRKEGQGDTAEWVDLGEIPEALLEVSRLRDRLATLPALRDPIRAIEDAFGKKTVAAITGKSSAKKRKQLMAEFQAGQRSVAVISKAGKTGISLHDVNGNRRRMLVADYEWSADTFKQELGRVDRTGQRSNPEVTLMASNIAGERKFAATIAARMASLGATSKGSAEATGTDALDQFDVADSISLAAMKQTIEQLFGNPLRDYLTGSKWYEWRKSEETRQWERFPKRRPDEVSIRDFLLDLMMFPVHAADEVWAMWNTNRDALISGESTQAALSKRTGRLQGEITRTTDLSKKGEPQLTLFEVKNAEGERRGILQGFVTHYINRIQGSRGTDEHGATKSRRYIQFTAPTGLVSGLELTPGEVRRVKEDFGRADRSTITPDAAWEDLNAGERVKVNGPDNVEWTLRQRQDGKIAIEGATLSKHGKVLNGIAQFATVGNLLYVPGDRASFEKFIARYPLKQPDRATKGRSGETKQAPDETDDGSSGTTMYAVGDPFSAIVASVVEIRKIAARRAKAGRDPLATSTLDEVNERMASARGVSRPRLRDQAKEALDALSKLTRHFPEIDPSRSPLEATIHEVLLEQERAPKWAQAKAYNELSRITDNLEPNEVDLMADVLALRDIVKDVERGLYRGKDELPFGYPDVDAVKADLATFEGNATAAVNEAIEKRQAFVRELAEELVAFDLLDAKALDDDRYYHRQVMAYFQPDANKAGPFIGGKGKEVRQRGRGFQKGRVGGTDFNLRYEQAEFEWVAQALQELKTAATLTTIKRLADQAPTLKKEAKFYNEAMLGAKVAKSMGMDPEVMGPEVAQQELAPFRQRIGRAISGILAALEDVDVGGSLGDSIDEMVRRHEAWKSAEKDGRFPLGSRWWQIVAALAEGEHGSATVWARSLFKAIADKESFIKGTLGSDYINPRNPKSLAELAPEGYTTWQPEQGNHFYRATGIEDKAVQAILSSDRKLNKADLKDLMVMGGAKETWIVPQWLASSLSHFGVQPTVQGPLGALDRGLVRLTGKWKQYILHAPTRAIKYNLNNFSGDVDAALAYGPAILKGIPDAAKTLWHQQFKRTAPEGMTRQQLDAETERLVELGVIDAGITAAEIPDITDLPAFQRLAEADPITFMGILQTYFKWTRELSQYRENILRLAAYRYFEKRVLAGEKNIYAGSNPDRVRAETNPRRRAALLARDLIGDYGATSAFTQFVRQRMLPFFSFQEVNFKRYMRLLRNLPLEAGQKERASWIAGTLTMKGGKQAAKLALQANLFFLAAALWNASVYPDEEEELRRRGRQGLHVILGRYSDGSVRSMRIEGAFGALLEWVGLRDYPEDIRDLVTGDADLGDKAMDAIKAPVNRVVQLWEPFTKMVGEQLTKKSTYPDAFRPTPIRDRGEHAARLLALDNLYRKVTGKPSPPGNWVDRTFFYRTDPGEAAYFDMKSRVAKYLDEQDKPRSSAEPTEKGNALYYWKRAIQWGDTTAAKKWEAEYRRLGGSGRGMKQSISMSEPLGGISKKDRGHFRAQLTPAERDVLDMANAWYNRIYRPKRIGAQPDSTQ